MKWMLCWVLSFVAIDVFAMGRSAALSESQRSQLVERREQIRSWVTRCSNGDFSTQGDFCDQGDLTLFAGLSCLSGETWACDSVKRSQGLDGRWWRGPSRVENDPSDSFSRDQSLGLMSYFLTTKDRNAANQWMNWVSDNDGLMCTRATDNRCMIMPGTWGLYGEVWSRLRLSPLGPMDTWRKYDPVLLFGQAITTDLGFPLHLEAVHLWLLRKMAVENTLLPVIARVIVNRDPDNLFFVYLNEGSTPSLFEKVLERCPSQAPVSRADWAWQRISEERPWLKSNGHDCVFLLNLMLEN